MQGKSEYLTAKTFCVNIETDGSQRNLNIALRINDCVSHLQFYELLEIQ